MFCKKHIFIIIVNLIILLLIAETTCRIKFYIAHKDPGYLLSPFIEVQFIQQRKNAPPPKTAKIINFNTVKNDTLLYSPCHDSLLPKTFNDHGWPGPDFSENKPEGVFRILAVGGSTVESQFNADIDTWCYRLGKLLNQDPALGGKVEVINSGQAGSNIVRIYKNLKEKGFKLRPDLIIYYEAGNDMKEVNFWRQADNMASRLNKSLVGKLFSSFHYRSMLYTYLIEKYSFDRVNKNKYINHKDFLADYFGWLIEDCHKKGIEFVYVKQVCNFPIEKDGYDLRNLKDVQKLLDTLIAQRDRDDIPKNASEEYWHAFRCIEQRLIVAVESDICREKGGFVIDPLVDFEQARKGSQLLFSDMVHKTCFGDSILALSIYNSLRDKVVALYAQK
jgi:hypothetical protein